MPSDWLTAVMAANQKACLKSVLVYNDLLITISDSKPDPRTSEIFSFRYYQILLVIQ